MKRNTLTLHVYLYSYNSFPSEGKICTLYTNKYYLYDKEYCSEHINILDRLYILTSYLMKLLKHFDIILPSVSSSSRVLFPSVLYVIMYWGNIFLIWHVDGCFR